MIQEKAAWSEEQSFLSAWLKFSRVWGGVFGRAVEPLAVSSSNKKQTHVGVFGADFYPPTEQSAAQRAPGEARCVGRGCRGIRERVRTINWA